MLWFVGCFLLLVDRVVGLLAGSCLLLVCLFEVCCLLWVVCCMLFVVCRLLVVVRCGWFVGCCLLCVVCRLLFVV